MSERQLHAVVEGGSIGGLSAAHALLKAGLKVTVYEQAPSVAPAGAGLGLDEKTCKVLEDFRLGEGLSRVTLPLNVEVNSAVKEDLTTMLVTRDDHMNYRSTHWSDIHRLLLDALPKGIVHYAHRVIDCEQASGKVKVIVETPDGKESAESSSSMTVEADLMVAASGSMSHTWQKFKPDDKRRYSGYCAWRGLLQDKENPEVAAATQDAYTELGSALYFEMAPTSHAVLYELPGKRLNWLWYVNQPEPELKGSSVTVKATQDKVEEMHKDAERTFSPALAKLMKATAQPFINAIFDRKELDEWVFGNVVLLGEAAHPTTPHGLRSTNMAICDAAALGAAFQQYPGDIAVALKAYQDERLPVTTREMLFSRYLGQVKQNLRQPDVDWTNLPPTLKELLLQRNRDTFDYKVYQAPPLPLPQAERAGKLRMTM